MDDGVAVSDIESQVASRLKTLRARQGLTLDELAIRSGVSRSMISCIERAESSPTARVLDKLAASLGVSLASLFADEECADAAPISRRTNQPTWSDPETGYIRRDLSPSGFPSPMKLTEIVLPPGTSVKYDSGVRAAAVHHQVWVAEGALEVTLDGDTYQLATGDCLALRLGRSIAYANPGTDLSRYIVVTATDVAPPVSGSATGRKP